MLTILAAHFSLPTGRDTVLKLPCSRQKRTFRAFDNENGVLLVLFDLSAAFDTEDHNILFSHLKNLWVTDVHCTGSGPISLIVHSVFASVEWGPASFLFAVESHRVVCLALFSSRFTPSRSTVLDKHNFCHHFYADDIQIYLPFRPKCTGSYDESKSRLESCISDVRIWMANNFLKLIDSKSEFLILRPSRQSAHLSKVPAPLAIGRCQVSPAVSARNIGVIFDETMSMDKQIRQVCKSAFHQLHNIRSIRKFLDRDALQTLVHALVTSKLDSFNSLYSELPVCQIMKLQRVQNAAARLVLGIPRCEHITPGLKSRHWLLVEKRIAFKLCLLVYKTRYCLAPSYLCSLLLPYAPARQLRLGSRNLMVVPRARMQTYRNRLFSVAASVQWNQLPDCIRRQETMAAFKFSLKSHLFRISYGI